MDDILFLLSSPEFRRVIVSVSVIVVFLAVVISALGLAFYGRGRESAADPADQTWVMVFATWRDSMIITLFFIAQGMMYRLNDFQGMLLDSTVGSLMIYGPLIAPIINLLLDIAIFAVALLRILALSRWLKDRVQ